MTLARRSLALVAEEHAGEDEHRADEEVEGDALREHEPGEENGGDGVEIDVVGGHDGTKLLQGPVPRDEADHGGHAAQPPEVVYAQCKDTNYFVNHNWLLCQSNKIVAHTGLND